MKSKKSFFTTLKSIFILCFCFSLTFAFPQEFPSDYVSRILTASDGLPGNTITDLIQDDKGYIYIGTYDGLVRYDGFEFTVLNKNTVKAFECVSARCVFEDSKGRIWVGSNDEGVVKIEKNVVTMYTTKDGLPNNSIRDITEDKDGNIWFGTAAGVVFLNKDNKFVTPKGLQEHSSDKDVSVHLYCDTAGRIWLTTSRVGGIFYYSSGKFEKYTLLDSLGDITVTCITQEANGSFWFGLGLNGAIRVEDGEIQCFNASNGFTNNTVNCIYRDTVNDLWFGTEDGVLLLKDQKWHYYTETQGLTSNSVKKIVEDREGNIWLATTRGGVEKMSMGKFRTQSLPYAVNAIAEDNSGLVWVGSDEGLLCYNKNILIETELTKLCKGLRVRHVGIANNGDLLVSCYSQNGQIRLTKDGIIKWTTEQGLAGEKVRVAVEDSKNNLWVGTTTGLSLIQDNKVVKNYYLEDGLNNDYIMCVFEDSKGNIWIGTDGGGVNVLKDGVVTESFTSGENGLAGNVIFKIFEDKEGVIWICTGTGISRYENKKFFNYDTSKGLGVDSVFQILIDYTDTLWITSNKGISTVKLEEMNKLARGEISKIDPKFFNQNDGLRSGGITSTSLSMCDSYGKLWFPLIDGYAVYDPQKIKSNRTWPYVHIESVIVDDVEYNIFDKKINVPAGAKRIEIKYTGLSFISSELVRFKSKLQGFDEEYSAISSTRTVSYTNLKPGDYVFSVMASNSDGLWSFEPATIEIKQQPFFYETLWFWILFALSVLFLIVLITRIREGQLMQEQLRLENMVQIKTEDLKHEKDNSDRLLKNILPDPIAQRLKDNMERTIADRFENVSVLFADIVNFTELADGISAEELVNTLNDLFSRFDQRARIMGIEKIKTIGDAYMAVCGLPQPSTNNATRIIMFAMGMQEDLQDYNKTAKIPLEIRIGINCGPVVAGVIGKSKFIYDLWGDTVNVASRMESLCQPGKILVTESVKFSCDTKIKFESAQEYEVKGKGKMTAYIVKQD